MAAILDVAVPRGVLVETLRVDQHRAGDAMVDHGGFEGGDRARAEPDEEEPVYSAGLLHRIHHGPCLENRAFLERHRVAARRAVADARMIEAH